MNKRKINYFTNYIFLKRNFFLLLTIAGFALFWYTHYSGLPGDSAKVQIVLSIITIVFSVIVFIFSLMTCVPPYLTLWFKKRILESDDLERDDIIKINFKETSPEPGFVQTEIRIYGIKKPPLGFAKVRIIFDDFSQTEDLLLDKTIKEGGKKVGIMAQKSIWLPNIRDYRIDSSIVHFEDFFHLFSLPYREVEHAGLFTEPPQTDGEDIEITTHKSEEPVMKVVQHKVAKGELLDYKKYAPGDDIRRIIWKNYARNRELTVRIHDRTFPYVSHINLLVSFYDGSPSQNQPVEIKEHLLDIYKEKIRQIVDSIMEQGYTVQFVPDQKIGQHYQLDEYEQILYIISASQWQSKLPLDRYLKDNYRKLRGGSNLLVFSSLCPVDQLQNLNGRAFEDLNLCFYNVTETLSGIKPPALLKRVFFTDAYGPLENAKRKHNARNTIKFIDQNGSRISRNFSQSNLPVIEL